MLNPGPGDASFTLFVPPHAKALPTEQPFTDRITLWKDLLDASNPILAHILYGLCHQQLTDTPPSLFGTHQHRTKEPKALILTPSAKTDRDLLLDRQKSVSSKIRKAPVQQIGHLAIGCQVAD